MGRHKLFLVDGFELIWGKMNVPDDVAELIEKIRDIEIRFKGRDEEVRRQQEQHQTYVKEKEEKIMRQQQQHRLDMKGIEE
ncbi:hypothetical protein Gogos_011773 [Gossypium gossypioides]|uniref:Uncharacterized protein n=1 Tax=Gossypium gossypioides TaxID=34282 RepID=A0A7J9BQI1_GOSGO|nr:hypothetical protein [Gossypium gossypioides]